MLDHLHQNADRAIITTSRREQGSTQTKVVIVFIIHMPDTHQFYESVGVQLQRNNHGNNQYQTQ